MRRAALGLLLLLAAAGLAQEPPAPARPPRRAPIGVAREVAVVPRAPRGQLVRVVVAVELPDGAVLSATLRREDGPACSTNLGGAARGEVTLLLELPAGAPGLYEVEVVHDPAAQPRWLEGRSRVPGRRALPVAAGTPEDAQAARDAAAQRVGALADAVVGLAAEVAQAWGPRARPFARASLEDWLRDRMHPALATLDQALAVPAAGADRAEGALRALAARALAGLGARARARCLALGVAVPERFARAGAVSDEGQEDALLADALAGRARARRDALGAEPRHDTIERLSRRVAWLAAAASAPADVGRPEVVTYLVDDLRRGLARLRPALLARQEPAAGPLAAALGALEARLAGATGEASSLAAAADAWRPLEARLAEARDLVTRGHWRLDLAELVALRERLADVGGDAGASAAWRRRLAVCRALLAGAPRSLADLAAWLEAAAADLAARRPVAPEADARWRALLAAAEQAVRS